MSQTKKLVFILNTQTYEEFTPKLFGNNTEIITYLSKLIEAGSFGVTLKDHWEGNTPNYDLVPYFGKDADTDEILDIIQDFIEEETYAVYVNEIETPTAS